jgi:hypothetical protein
MVSHNFSVRSRGCGNVQVLREHSTLEMSRGSWNILLLYVPQLLEHSTPNVPQLREHLKKYVDSDFLGGWNIHQVKAFQPDSPPNTVLPLDQADLFQPTFRGRQKGPVYDGSYQLVVPDREIRWPPPEHDGPVTNGSRTAPPFPCRSCVSPNFFKFCSLVCSNVQKSLEHSSAHCSSVQGTFSCRL